MSLRTFFDVLAADIPRIAVDLGTTIIVHTEF
jgi:hypothetical protein